MSSNNYQNKGFGWFLIITIIISALIIYCARIFINNYFPMDLALCVITTIICSVMIVIVILLFTGSFIHGLFGGGSLIPIILCILLFVLAIMLPIPVISTQWLDYYGESAINTQLNPDGTIIAIVVSEDCGATCDCRIRIDLVKGATRIERIWSGYKICNVKLTWINSQELLLSPLHNEFTPIIINVKEKGL